MRRAMMSGGANATIVPNSPRRMSSTALPPNRVASTRSKLVGAPPRCRWPSTTDRVSLPVSPCSASQTCAPMPPSRSAVRAVRRFDQRHRPAFRIRAFGDDDDAELRAPFVALAQPLRDQRDVERDLRESGWRRRRRPRRRRARSSRRSAPSPRRRECVYAPRRSCAAGRSRRWRRRRRCRIRNSWWCRRCRCRSSSARRRSACPSHRTRARSPGCRRRRSRPAHRAPGAGTSSSTRSA